MTHKYYHKNKACCILMGIKIFAKKVIFSRFKRRIVKKNNRFYTRDLMET